MELQIHAPLAGWRTGALASTRSDTYSLASYYRMRVATRSYTLAAGALQTGRPVTYTLALSLFA